MTTPLDWQDEAQAFFEAFAVAFRAFDGPVIAQRYAAPYLALSAEGTLKSFTTQEQIGEYFHGIVAQYHSQGCRACRFNTLAVTPLGSNSALASITWELLGSDDSVISAWRESYTLMRTPDGLRVFASIDHAL
ncbi:hypothetical protein [Aquipseudomonas ullengensis]|uniref:SnoaL-like domain-containing protein n=1 Tax=Aquipseudomonas ullengensis TaxID=2759166 RepID=A0A7W4LMP2_9GAMM|nr:hypothetical protein [Pseudomonas ullengensis]MBB2495981.1 hypothetical protein [Pseudomonas ullengensis]